MSHCGSTTAAIALADVADQIGSAAEVLVDHLPEKHRRSIFARHD